MIFRQITHDDLGCASYLIGDEDAGVAAVVDPKLDIEEYLALARYMGVRIEHILETHNHADHVRGIQVHITPVVDAAEHGRMRRCLELFENFCVVTQSVRSGIDVDVAVEPVAPLAPSGDARTTGVTAG